MNLPSVIRNPLIAAILGALTIAVPAGALYLAGATRAVATAPSAAMAMTGGATGTSAAASPATPAPAAGPATMLPDFSSMVQKYGPAVVNISVVSKVSTSWNSGDNSDDNPNDNPNDTNPFGPNSPFAPFFRGLPFQMPQPQPMRGEGSGFIIRPDGVIMTNAHVVDGASEVTVRLTDRREYTAKVVGVDPKSDIAILRIPAKDLPTVRIGDSRGLKVGEWVLAIGAPFGFENSATAGIVSAKGRTLDSGYVPFIQTDVPINPGNSGGPLFNMRGEVVGINSQIYSRSGAPLKDSSELPVQIAAIAPGTSVTLEIWRNHATREITVKLGTVADKRTAANGGPHPEGGKLGLAVRPLTADEQRGANTRGGLVVERASGPAAEAGIRPGDVVLAANGSPVHDAEELRSAVESSKGHVARLIQRGDARLFVPVRVG